MATSADPRRLLCSDRRLRLTHGESKAYAKFAYGIYSTYIPLVFMSWAPVVQSSLEWLWRILGIAIHVRVRSHRAFFREPPRLAGQEACFITVTNTSLTREIEVTHAWFEAPNGQIPAAPSDRPLPVRLKPQQIWETWALSSAFSPKPPGDVTARARVRLSDGRTVKGKHDPSTPHSGSVPGGATSW